MASSPLPSSSVDHGRADSQPTTTAEPSKDPIPSSSAAQQHSTSGPASAAASPPAAASPGLTSGTVTQGVIEPDVTPADDSASDADSGVGSDSQSILTSLASTITNYVYKNGRRYAGFREGNYILPNDELECDRHDLLQHIYRMLFGGELLFAPIGDNPQRMLDIGTGTGIWAMDLADMYPSAEVIGTDLSPIQPKWVPPNLQFEIDDAESEWTYQPDTFDFIHFQNLTGAIRNWPKLLSQIYTHLKPGGWVEAKEADVIAQSDTGSIPAESALRRWETNCIHAGNLIGLQLESARKLKQWMEEAGFVDVVDREYKLPSNPWPKDEEMKLLGRYQHAQYMDALQAFALGLLVDVLGWTREEMEVFLVDLRKDLSNRRFHAFHVMYVLFYLPTCFLLMLTKP
ncbi:S-adenosyl-L-methionine-dependent methyltransferase [Xylona heveae TC161]|uniref:S-adenosyl-L-methionine-dependent methyltransferase n=1 Tax=Xylona heveae (strain CBS 132557 / TC161) TaxID=1328760 RepID=A0A161TH76_XYLHT|nr:S-adenosyl-L-methionine-dependent methyltransferase [Xylona heveae TC161]KZF25587.1 S-adenosyl-L-methionine-dependent methyltransferase [Xylona heveae TC161]